MKIEGVGLWYLESQHKAKKQWGESICSCCTCVFDVGPNSQELKRNSNFLGWEQLVRTFARKSTYFCMKKID